MKIVDFLEMCKKMDDSVSLVPVEELEKWNTVFGMPRNHLKEALLNLKEIKESSLFFKGCLNELRAEANLVSKIIEHSDFMSIFENESTVNEYGGQRSIVFAKCDIDLINGVLKEDVYEDVYILDDEERQYFIKNSEIHICRLRNIYSISQVMNIVMPIMSGETVEIYFCNRRILFDKSKKLVEASGMELFWSTFYQMKYLEQYTNLCVDNEKYIDSYNVDEYDRIIYLKLSGLKKYKPVYEKKEHIIAFHRYKDYGDPRYLNYPHQWVGENFLSAAYHVKENGHKYGIFPFCSSEINIKDVDVIFFWDMPDTKDVILEQALRNGKRMILFATESVGINRENENRINVVIFEKIATWRENKLEIAKIKYVPPVYFDSREASDMVPFKQRKKIVMIGSIYRKYNVPHGLYQEREKCVRWMEKNHISDFDFYGKKTKSTINDFISYKGVVKDKIEILKKYKYCICFENNNGYRQYVSEKIYDCLFARCVPIYLGAPDIELFVPPNCYIDMRRFSSYEALWEYIDSLDEDAWNAYIEAINEFLDSESIKRYNGEHMLRDIYELLK